MHVITLWVYFLLRYPQNGFALTRASHIFDTVQFIGLQSVNYDIFSLITSISRQQYCSSINIRIAVIFC